MHKQTIFALASMGISGGFVGGGLTHLMAPRNERVIERVVLKPVQVTKVVERNAKSEDFERVFKTCIEEVSIDDRDNMIGTCRELAYVAMGNKVLQRTEVKVMRHTFLDLFEKCNENGVEPDNNVAIEMQSDQRLIRNERIKLCTEMAERGSKLEEV